MYFNLESFSPRINIYLSGESDILYFGACGDAKFSKFSEVSSYKQVIMANLPNANEAIIDALKKISDSMNSMTEKFTDVEKSIADL